MDLLSNDLLRNFENWFRGAFHLSNNPQKIEEYIVNFSVLFDSISKTGFLPDPIIDYTELFLSKLATHVIKPILIKSKNDIVQLPNIRNLLTQFLDFSIYGLLSLEKSVVDIAIVLLETKDKELYVSAHGIYKGLCGRYINIGAMKIINEKLKGPIQDLKFYNLLIKLTEVLKPYDKEFNDLNYISVVSNTLLQYIQSKSNSIDVDDLALCIENHRNALHNNPKTIQNFISSFLPLLTHFLSSNLFEQRLSALKEIQTLTVESFFQNKIAEYFSNNINLLSQLEFNEKYAEAIGDILSVLVHYGNVPQNFVDIIWNKGTFLHASQKNSFYYMFNRFADFGEGDILKKTITNILSLEHSAEWYDILDNLTKKLETKENIIELLDEIRNFLMVESKSNNPNFERAKKSLMQMITYGANESTFLTLSSHLRYNDKFTLEMLNNFLKDSSKIKISPNSISLALNQAINLLKYVQEPPLNEEPCELLKDFISKLGNRYKQPLTLEQLSILCSHEFPNIFSFLNSLTYQNLIIPDHLEFLLQRFNIGDKMFFKLIKRLIFTANHSDRQVTKLPLEKEEIMWNFAIGNTQHRVEFEKLLCQIYASNDGVELTDISVISAFLEKWQEFFSENQSSDMIELLRTFIYIFDSQSYPCFEKAHNYDPRTIDIVIYWTEQQSSMKFKAHPSTTIGSIIEKIAKSKNIQVNTPVLRDHNTQQIAKRTQPVSIFSYDDRGKQIAIFDISYQKSRKIRLHIRNAKASEQIINQQWIQEIFNRLFDNDISTYNLFKLLPQFNKTPNFYDCDLDLSKVFPQNCLCFLLYNLITLLNLCKSYENQVSEQHISPTPNGIILNLVQHKHFDDYLISLVNKSLINNFNLYDLNDSKNYVKDELIIELGRYFLDFFSLIPSIDFKKNLELYIILMKMALLPKNLNYSNSIKFVLDRHFPKTQNLLPFPENFEYIFQAILFNDSSSIKQLGQEQFCKLKIPTVVFMNCLSNVQESLTEEFFNLLRSQLSDDFLNFPIFTENILHLLYSKSINENFLQNILDLILTMLQRGILNENLQNDLLNFLINKFLLIDSAETHDQITFKLASRCITNLSNANTSHLKELLNQYHINRQPYNEYNISGDDIKPYPFHKVGLVNIGMTCYLDSILQQFYNIKPFRYAIMSYEGDNILIQQLGKLFETMKYLKKRSVSPKNFVDNYFHWGEKLDPRVQQDAPEFIQSFFDNIKGDPSIKMISERLFSGTTTYTVKETDKYEVKVNHDYFEMFELEVKDIPNMEQSFEHFVEPNYFPNDLTGNINVKQAILTKIPPFLIIQLKRFDYDFVRHERIKTSQKYDVLKTINISKYTDDKEEAIYDLIGVIIHRGVAQGGHYVSLVKTNKNGWLCFDDDVVTKISENEVLKQASGTVVNKVHWDGYILYYARRNVSFPYKKPQLSESVKCEIDESNKLFSKQQLLCSSGYYELMKGLSKLPNNDFIDILFKYSIDTLPYSKVAEDSKDFYTLLAERQKNIGSHLFIEYLCSGFLFSVLLECPNNQIRNGICNIIKASFPKNIFDKTNFNDEYLINFAEQVFNLVDNCLFFYSNIDDLFNVLSYLVGFDSIKSLAETKWKNQICSLFLDGVNRYILVKKTLKESYIFNGMDLTHFVKFICKLDLGNNAFSDHFYLNVCLSKTRHKEIALLTQKYFSKDDFLALIHNHVLDSVPFKEMSLIFHIVPDEAIKIGTTYEFKKTGNPCKMVDIITLFAAVATIYPETSETLVKYCDQWIPLFLLDEDDEARNNTVTCILYLIPCEDLANHGYFELNIPDLLFIPEINISTKPKNEVMLNRAEKLLNCLLHMEPHVEELFKSSKTPKNKINIENRACQYFQIINEILQLIPYSVDLQPIVNLYSLICQIDKEFFSEQIVNGISLINNFNIPITYDQLILAIPKKILAKHFQNLCKFLPPFLNYIIRVYKAVVTNDFFEVFLNDIAFASLSRIYRCLNDIKHALNELYPLHQQIINEIYFKRSKKWESSNIVMLIYFAEITKKKLILIPSLSHRANEIIKLKLDINKIILDAINNSRANSYTKQDIEKLCQLEEVSESVKQNLQALIQ